MSLRTGHPCVIALQDNYRARGYSENIAMVYGGIVAGVAAALVTHPFDTVKTIRQSHYADVCENSSSVIARRVHAPWCKE